MTHKLTTAFDSRMINTFKRAIIARDVDKVRAALDAGVDPATPISGGISPLIPLIYDVYEETDVTALACDSAEDYEANTSAIIDMLFAAGLQVAEPEKYETARFDYLVDHMLHSDNQHDAATVILHAVYERFRRGEDGYQPRLRTQLLAVVENTPVKSQADVKNAMTYGVLMLESLHETVRARLHNPTSGIEQKLVEEFGDRLGYWTGPFSHPSQATLEGIVAYDEDENGKAVLTVLPTAGQRQAQAQQKETADDKKKLAGDPRFAEMVAPLVQTLKKRDSKEILAEIERDFVGLDAVKGGARKLVIRQQFDMARQVQNQNVTRQNHSTVFLGNPGLGKTTFARKKAELLHSLGLAGPNYVEVSRENIVGGFIGHTEGKMTALFQMADVIFIDEAYSLNEGRADSGDFGKKVIDALVPALENNPDLVVFMAGYPEEMDKLLSANPGLRSRLTRYETFEDMTRDQLGQTLDHMIAREEMTLDPAARTHILDQLDASRNQLGVRNFGNARLVRNVVQHLPDVMAERLFGATLEQGTLLVVPGVKELNKVTLADAQALDYGSVFGTRTAAQSADPLPPSHPDWKAGIGFTATLRQKCK